MHPIHGGDDTRTRILKSTIRMFNEYGPMVPMSKISEAAGIAAGTPFRYFKTKEELLLAAYHHALMSVNPVKREDPRQQTTAEGAVKAIVRDVLRWSILFPEDHEYVEKYEDAYYYNYFSDEFLALFQGVVDELGLWDLIGSAVRSDLPRIVISRILSVHCSVFCRYMNQRRMKLDTPETDALMEASADSIWNSIRAMPPER